MVNVLVVGSGGFGKHYARILSSESVDNVIITRTSLDSAVEQARALQETNQTNVIGAEVSNPSQLDKVLDEYKPFFIAIAAKDPKTGDNIHPLYTSIAAKYGIVLCEKPFANAKGDGKSLEFFEFDNNEKFGLELPYTIIYNDMQKNKELYQHLLNAKNIRFAWITKGSGNDVIDNLALHPWSLLPPEFKIKKADVKDNGSNAKADMEYHYNNHSIRIEILLTYGGNFTGLEIDGNTIGIKRQGTTNTLVDTQLPLEKAVELGNDGLDGKELLKTENPLKQHIIAALHGKPIAGLDKAYDSQKFLEILHGYPVDE